MNTRRPMVDRPIPLTPTMWGSIRLPHPLTPSEWEQLMVTLRVFEPAIVARPEVPEEPFIDVAPPVRLASAAPTPNPTKEDT